ncbi:hypothetical protein Tco_0568038 [Tanacetum coccineum]
MMPNSIEHGPLVYDTIEVDGVTRTKTYEGLTDVEKLQDDCDVGATQGLPPEVYYLVNHHDVAKDIWDQGESLHEYYLRFSQLMNDMHTIGMTMDQVQVNTKFLNSLPPEWSKLGTNVKFARNMHTTNYDQLYSYLSQHEALAIKVRLMRERFLDSLALIANNPHLPSYLTHYQQ